MIPLCPKASTELTKGAVERCLRQEEPVHLVCGWEGDRPHCAPTAALSIGPGPHHYVPLLLPDASILPPARPSQQSPLSPRPAHGPHSPVDLGRARPPASPSPPPAGALSTVPRCPSYSRSRVPDPSMRTLGPGDSLLWGLSCALKDTVLCTAHRPPGPPPVVTATSLTRHSEHPAGTLPSGSHRPTVSIARSGDQEAPEERDLARPGRGAHAGSNSSEGLAARGQGSHLSAGGGVARQRDHEVWPHLIPLVFQKRPNIRIFCQPQEGQIPSWRLLPGHHLLSVPAAAASQGFPHPVSWLAQPT